MSNEAERIYGELPLDWKYTTVDELIKCGLADLQTGPFGTALLASEYKSAGTPVIAVKNIGQNIILLDDDIPRVNEKKRQELIRYTLQAGDIVFGRKGAVDRRAIVTPHEAGWLQGSDCIRLRFLDHTVEPRYVSYILGTPQHVDWVIRNAGGSTMPSLNQRIIGRIPILLPPLPEQRAIAEILGSLDDKIEANRRQIATLEATARAIFKSWFVEFDPVHAKARGEIPQGIDAETAVIFPDSFEESEPGLIPCGWRVEPIGDHVKATKGLSYKGEYLVDNIEDGIPMHNLNSINEWGTYKLDGIKFYSGDYQSRHEVKPGDLIVANTEQGFDLLLIASPAIVPAVFGSKGIISHHVYKVEIKPKSSLTRLFLYYRIMMSPFRDLLQGYTNGTTVNMLPADAFERPQFVVPPAELMQRFESIVAPMLEQIEHIYEESRTLAETRDALLPRLVSGELQVGEV